MSAASPDPQEVAQTCYTMAYFVLPRYISTEPAKVLRELSMGLVGAMFFYLISRRMEGHELTDSDGATAAQLQVHADKLDGQHDYFIIQYPSPPPMDISAVTPEQQLKAMEGTVLAPYFSAVLREQANGSLSYFVLGQSPIGNTTLRRVTLEFNANLGPGCEPQLGPFLQLLRDRRSADWIAGIQGPGSG